MTIMQDACFDNVAIRDCDWVSCGFAGSCVQLAEACFGGRENTHGQDMLQDERNDVACMCWIIFREYVAEICNMTVRLQQDNASSITTGI